MNQVFILCLMMFYCEKYLLEKKHRKKHITLSAERRKVSRTSSNIAVINKRRKNLLSIIKHTVDSVKHFLYEQKKSSERR